VSHRLSFLGFGWSGALVSKSTHESICSRCNEPFFPDLRNRTRQRSCYRPECRKARKVKSHQLWLAKNPNHFKGKSNVIRTQQWRVAHPKYWRRSKAKSKPAPLQDAAPSPPTENHQVQPTPPLQDGVPPLQDSITRNPLIIGIISHVFRCTLQDSLEVLINELIIKGTELRAAMAEAQMNQRQSTTYAAKDTLSCRTPPPSVGPSQLACSPPSAAECASGPRPSSSPT
jgi:hypothetical protein